MSASEWQCRKCLTYFDLSIDECTECNEYDKHGFNGYYADTKMNIETYKWIKGLEQKLKGANELIDMLLEVREFYADKNNYDDGSDSPNAAGSWKLLVGRDYGVLGDEFIEDCGKKARENEDKINELLKAVRDE